MSNPSSPPAMTPEALERKIISALAQYRSALRCGEHESDDLIMAYNNALDAVTDLRALAAPQETPQGDYDGPEPDINNELAPQYRKAAR